MTILLENAKIVSSVKLSKSKEERRMKKILALVLAIVMCMSVAMADGFTASTYTAVGQGKFGDVEVKVTFDENGVTAIELGSHGETPGFFEKPAEEIPSQIIANQSLAVDTVAGATMTSEAILAAVEDCVKQAGGEAAVEQMKNAAVAAPDLKVEDIVYKPGTYSAAAMGKLGPVNLTVTFGEKAIE